MFEVHFLAGAAKYIKKLARITKERIKKALLLLSENPYHTNLDIHRLVGYENSFKLRIGKYRVLYKIMEVDIVIFVFDCR